MVAPLSPSSSGILVEDPVPPLTQADPVGAVSPNIFLSDWLPLTVAFCRAELDAGNSGNRELDNAAGARDCPDLDFRVSFAPGPGTEVGARNPEAELDAQGVFRCPCRTVGTMAGNTGCSAGNLSGGRGTGAGVRFEAEAEEPAAWATRSQSCLDDC